MAKLVSEINLDPSKLTKKEISCLRHAGRSMRIECPLCGQGWVNVINCGPLKNVMWCYECDSVFSTMKTILNFNKNNKNVYGLVSKLEELGLDASKCEITEGYIKIYSEE